MNKANVSSSGSRIPRVLKVLRGHALNGISSGGLAAVPRESPASIDRAFSTLIEEELALKLEDGHSALSVQLLQIAMAHSNEMVHVQDCINEISQHVISDSHS